MQASEKWSCLKNFKLFSDSCHDNIEMIIWKCNFLSMKILSLEKIEN